MDFKGKNGLSVNGKQVWHEGNFNPDTKADAEHTHLKSHITDFPTKLSQFENDKHFVTQEELGNAGYGDMMKAVYDTDNDGKVDKAEMADTANSVAWGNVTGKPSTFPPSGHSHNVIIGDDTRNDNLPPSAYMQGGSKYLGRVTIHPEFKVISVIGAGAYLAGTYCELITFVPWSDSSGGYPIQIALGNGIPCWRVGTSATTWSEWRPMIDTPYHVGASAPTNKNLIWYKVV